MTSGYLRNYYRDELNDDANYPNDPNKNVINSKSFKHKKSITGSIIDYNVAEKITNADGNGVDNPVYDAKKIGTKEVEIVAPLKYLRNFWTTLDMPLINCEFSLTLSWSTNCVITSMGKIITTVTNRGDSPTNATFKIKDTKLYVSVVTISAPGDNKLLEQLKTGFKRTIKWNKYMSEMSNQDKSWNLN